VSGLHRHKVVGRDASVVRTSRRSLVDLPDVPRAINSRRGESWSLAEAQMGAPVTPSPPREGSYVTHFVSLAGTKILVIPHLTPARRQPRALRTAQFALLMLRRELPLASDSPERLDPREIQMNRALQLAKQECRRNAMHVLFFSCVAISRRNTSD